MKHIGIAILFALLSNISMAAEKKVVAREPASPGSFICSEPMITRTTQLVQYELNANCDNSKNFSINFVPDVGYMVCCIKK